MSACLGANISKKVHTWSDCRATKIVSAACLLSVDFAASFRSLESVAFGRFEPEQKTVPGCSDARFVAGGGTFSETDRIVRL